MGESHRLAEVEDLSVEFRLSNKVVHAVRNATWALDRGETLAVLGESGSGKSVMASAFMGLIDSPPGFITSGRLCYAGRDLLALPGRQRREINGREMAMIFQDTLAALNPVHSIGRQIAETLRVHGVSAREADERALDLLNRVGINDSKRRFFDYPHQFSGGQRQRVMIAMAIALRPGLLIADEPTTALDVTIQAQILALLMELQADTGMGLLLITHDVGVVAEVADRVLVMKGGEIVETGPVRQVLSEPQHPYTRQLMNSVPGRRQSTRAAGPSGGELILRVRGLTKHYPVTRGFLRSRTSEFICAVDSVNFDLRRGETVGIVGESGSGKSTLARTLLGLEFATGGEAFYHGVDILKLGAPSLKDMRRRIQVVFQDPAGSLNPRMTVAKIVSEPWEVHAGIVPPEQRREQAINLLKQVGLEAEHIDRYPHQFSGGQQQRIAIARALALMPELIICDEAVSALDVSVQAQVITLLKQLKQDFGLSYLFIAHDLPVVRDFADRVLVMWRGSVVEQGTTDQIFGKPQHPYTRELLAASPNLDLPFTSSFKKN